MVSFLSDRYEIRSDVEAVVVDHDNMIYFRYEEIFENLRNFERIITFR